MAKSPRNTTKKTNDQAPPRVAPPPLTVPEKRPNETGRTAQRRAFTAATDGKQDRDKGKLGQVGE